MPEPDAPSDEPASSDDDFGTAAQSLRRREREREREMQRLSRQIRKYHAQLLFVRGEMARTERSGLLKVPADGSGSGSGSGSGAGAAVSLVGSVSAAVLVATTALCWLLVVVQVGRGALSAIFVGAPDLTHAFEYFQAREEGAAAEMPLETAPPLVPHMLATACQLLSAALLFVVVMFGLLSMGASVEDSVHPLRFLASSYAAVLLRARQWDCLPRLLLHPTVLAAIDPSPHVSRLFFSSGADLASFYRHLQRQAAASPAAHTLLLPGGIQPERALKARMWGRRVFLLLDRHARPVSPTLLLAYVWIVCSLAMTWPSVLRTAGLISERAYVLPVASLVEPLWAAPSLEPMLDLGRRELDMEPIVVQPLDLDVHPQIQIQQQLLAQPAASMCAASHFKSEVAATPASSSRLAAAPLVRVALRLARRVSSHAHISLGYAVWWLWPDLIVPVSPATVDLQLGYTPHAPALPVSLSTFALSPAYSEWYAMLRRLELQTHLNQSQTIRLPGDAQAQRSKRWLTSLLETIMHGARSVAAFFYSVAAALLNRIWMLAGRAAHAAVHTALRPIWRHASLAATGLSSSVAYVVSRAIPLVIGFGQQQQSQQQSQQLAKSNMLLVLENGIYSMVPSIFVPGFWEAATAQHSPALQRLRPELWPHLFECTDSAAAGACIKDAAELLPSERTVDTAHSGIGSKLTLVPLQRRPVSVPQHADHLLASISKPDSDTALSLPLVPSSSKSDRSIDHSQSDSEAAASAIIAGGQDHAVNVRPVRKIWSTLDWVLAVYRVVLGLLACVFFAF
ncbi:hypothetical protein BX661DRAFT_186722 [Kickxella alabastrina]|uniref:uncharacterized protein n=1 Tax=Kickxella alabastrina TaxID=61397 RepID=UPI00221E9E78|nr:uncharacterized protein BX661DRAFT_186722 [Kickxella alabastrina]KAI7823489.1 hypothetical protein BX661DRAFT_186722 [Kickxella alabastrina]